MDLLLEMSNMCGAVCIFILGRLLSNVLVCVCVSIWRPLLWVCYWSCRMCGLCVYFYRASTVMDLLFGLSNGLCAFF